jgi:aspartate racemase
MNIMKSLGIIGGIASESTVEYYRQLVSGYLKADKRGHYPNIIINSIDMKKMLDLINTGKLPEVTDYLVGEIQRLAAAGAEIGLMASNTPHIVFDAIRGVSPIPLISIVEATCEQVRQRGLATIGLFGTRSTMQGNFYQRVFSDFNMTIITPNDNDQNYLHDHYMNEFVKGIFHDDVRTNLTSIITRMIATHGIQGLILGGTELPFILKQSKHITIPFFDTAKIHVDAALKFLLND